MKRSLKAVNHHDNNVNDFTVINDKTLFLKKTKALDVNFFNLNDFDETVLQVIDEHGNNALHLIASDTSYRVEKKNAMLDILLDIGVAINHQNDLGETPIMTAAKTNARTLNRYFFERLLQQSDIDLLIENKQGRNFFHLLVSGDHIEKFSKIAQALPD